MWPRRTVGLAHGYTGRLHLLQGVDSDPRRRTQSLKADQFTRVRYFDVSSYITDYSRRSSVAVSSCDGTTFRRRRLAPDGGEGGRPAYGAHPARVVDVQSTGARLRKTDRSRLRPTAFLLYPARPSSSIITQVLVGQASASGTAGATFGDLDVNSFLALGLGLW